MGQRKQCFAFRQLGVGWWTVRLEKKEQTTDICRGNFRSSVLEVGEEKFNVRRFSVGCFLDFRSEFRCDRGGVTNDEEMVPTSIGETTGLNKGKQKRDGLTQFLDPLRIRG